MTVIIGLAGAGRRAAEAEISGPGGAAVIDRVAAAGPDAIGTMRRESVAAVGQGIPYGLDVRDGLRLRQVIEAAGTGLIAGEA
ncbi:hypothetical protein [Streptosporangium roseum]|uniref:Uncharacterized protein n=1 Tax=Streptosporangium roseum (strain ATCC 12428 / DSM 43021 / JCM 3005 / KCTC 9067 / NCIMB 10171 / NRRL 2505 / NI 9100) TaxID=479432 RepID=D2B9A4_STRRD|nr:hypothetical protein [Streptosporangium roseum]ACZ91649.1 hypothetical protein Sros_9018 [Streptosporangium roseum DSM 43021]